MNLKIMQGNYTICQVCDISDITDMDDSGELTFFAKTEDEISLVIETEKVPKNWVKREDGWKAFRVEGTLEFSLLGILAGITKTLAECGISVFVVSTYNTDYVLVKENDIEKAVKALKEAGYSFV